jgi:peptide/nickel transport system permease protein
MLLENRYLRLLMRRLLQMLPTMLVVVLLAFTLMVLAPGDLADVMAAEAQIGDRDLIDAMRRLYGGDNPWYVQLVNYLGSVVRLDLGFSFRHNLPVSTLIVERIPATLLLMVAALGFAIVVGSLAGIAAARRRDSWTDRAISAAAAMCFAAPNFWLSLMLVVAFSIHLGWFPVAGMQTIGLPDASGWRQALDVAHHLALPALSLGLLYSAIYARVMRASMLRCASLDYVRTARAKGASEAHIAWRHVLRNALLPVVTLVSLHVATLFAGAVVVESVFSWPGLGSLLMEAVGARNYPVVMGVMICSAAVVLIANLLVDMLYMVLDPRVRL